MKGTVMGWIFLIIIFCILGVMVPAIFITAENETVINMSNSTYATQHKAIHYVAGIWQFGQYYMALLATLLLLVIVFILWMHKPIRRRF